MKKIALFIAVLWSLPAFAQNQYPLLQTLTGNEIIAIESPTGAFVTTGTLAGSGLATNIKITGSPVVSGGGVVTSPPLTISVSGISGAATGNAYISNYVIATDAAALSSNGLGSGTLYNGIGLNLDYELNSTSLVGNRVGGLFKVHQNATSSNSTQPGAQYAGLDAYCAIEANDNGTNTTLGSGAIGNCVGANIISSLTTGATNIATNIGLEVDTSMAAGSSAAINVGIQAIKLSTSAVNGVLEDAAFVVGMQNGALGWGYGLMLGTPTGGPGPWPFASTGTLIGTPIAGTVAEGLDIHLTTFTGHSINVPGFTIDGSGHLVDTVNSTNTSTNSTNLQLTGNQSNANTGNQQGIVVNPAYTATSGTLSAQYGILLQPANSSTGTIATMNSVRSDPTNNSTGPVTQMMGYRTDPANAAAGTITTMYGFYAKPSNASGGTIGTYYGLYLDTPANSGTITNRFGLYSADASATNVLAGNVTMSGLPASAGGGGLYICVDSTGAMYKKSACP